MESDQIGSNRIKSDRPIGEHRNVKINQILRNFYYELITKPINWSEIKTVLDVGAGDGRFSVWAKQKGLDVLSIDLQPQYDWIMKGNFTQIDFKENFDLVYCSHTLEHIVNHFEFAEKLESLTKKYLIVICPLPNKVFWDEPTHYRPYNAETLRRTFFRLKPIKLMEINIPKIITTSIGVFKKSQ
ncbi:MAG: methyltransferase domain-containing protein [Candidatus Diapherotrites archaeon]|nr:methyltransferase domain-containing protein [Candidatus Diapherotrites archaeon]